MACTLILKLWGPSERLTTNFHFCLPSYLQTAPTIIISDQLVTVLQVWRRGHFVMSIVKYRESHYVTVLDMYVSPRCHRECVGFLVFRVWKKINPWHNWNNRCFKTLTFSVGIFFAILWQMLQVVWKRNKPSPKASNKPVPQSKNARLSGENRLESRCALLSAMFSK